MARASLPILITVLLLTACRDSPPQAATASVSQTQAVPSASPPDSCTLPKFAEPALLPGFKQYFIEESDDVRKAIAAGWDSISPIGWVYINSYGHDAVGIEMPFFADTMPGSEMVAYLDYVPLCNGGGRIIDAVRVDSIYTYHMKVSYEEWGWHVRERAGDWVRVVYAMTPQGTPLHGWVRLKKDIVIFTDTITGEGLDTLLAVRPGVRP